MTLPDRPAGPPSGTSPSDEATVTLSEEQLSASTHRREVERARLVRYVESETVTRTVQVRREQVRIEREPIPPAAGALGSRPAEDGDQWMVLYDEEIVVSTRRVPRERVRLRTHVVIEQRVVSEVLRAERVEVSEQATDPGPMT
jgi:stress response protein YsnF